MMFTDRHHAGRELAQVLRTRISNPAVVYALPRGGVPVAAEIAMTFNLPLDLVIPRKIGHPGHPEYAIGAVTEQGGAVCNERECRRLDQRWLAAEIESQRQESRRRRELYCGGRPRLSAAGKCAVLVDDGLATGLTMLAAIREVRADGPSKLIVAVPVAPRETVGTLARETDDCVIAHLPEYFGGSVGAYYRDFQQLSDDDVLRELAACRQRGKESPSDDRRSRQ
ncbi:MAG TPA: phosphoribosyltransferase family protein [Gammaproteobacteria bacterium]|nr:phosphoribosyltransferase family protein [Gammaproteobacteria bacterium]